MKVKATRSFVARTDGEIHRHNAGDEFPLPPQVDWLKCGLVVAVGAVPAAGRKKAESKRAKGREKR